MTNELRVRGRSAAPGFAQGPLFVIDDAPATADRRVGAPGEELAALDAAIAAALEGLGRLVEGASGTPAEILGFQLAILGDEELAAPAREAIAAGRPAHVAWREALDAEIAGYATSGDEAFAARAADLTDIRDRVLDAFAGAERRASIPPGTLVVAVDLPPSRFLAVDWGRGGAIALTGGSSTSHVAMLARSHGVPMLVGVDATLQDFARRASQPALLDAEAGELIVAPSGSAREAFRRAAASYARADEASRERIREVARTADGTRIEVHLNVADPGELKALDPAICDGIGLVRTEFLFERSGGLPDEDEQLATYRRLVEWADGRPVTIRTLDAGGDKPIPGLTIDGESHPFLGMRGLRLSLARPDVFRVQLRALARAAAYARDPGQLKVMLPMVTLPRELEAARTILEEELRTLAAAGVRHARPRLGIMVEVPAAAIAADDFAADFFSIGSNDLVQYVAAAGRDNGAVADLADPVQPAMTRLIRGIVDVARARGIDVSLCGDAGGDPRALPALLQAGLRSVSVAPPRVARAKAAIAAVRLPSPTANTDGRHGD